LAREVLILSEKPVSSIDKLASALEATEGRIRRKNFDGFAALMDSATLAKIPFDDWQEIVAFLAEDRAGAEGAPALPRPRTLATSSFREERMIFGRNSRLSGVLCRPTAQQPAATVLFLNTGGNPHIGWGRMSVENARALAAGGIASLRMDIAGLGDATPLEGSPRVALYRVESIGDLREALDFLESRGMKNFTAVGHCSGAWLALNGAIADPRIRRLFLVNLQRFIWTGQENLEALMARAYRATDSYLQEIGSGVIWRRLLNGDVNWPRLPGIAVSIIRRAGARIAARVLPILARTLGIVTESVRIEQMLTKLSARGTDVLLVYSDTDPGRDELARHFGPSGCRLHLSGIRVATIENADHDITSEEARARYFNVLCSEVGADDRIASPSDQQTHVAKAA
jgi:pimeloyl-ACP methyl ester carboxylesterase